MATGFTNYINVVDDKYRPSYGDLGTPQAPTAFKLNFGDYGTGSMYASYHCSYTTGTTLNAKYRAECFIGGINLHDDEHQYWADIDIQATLQFSTNSFSSVLTSKTVDTTGFSSRWSEDSYTYYSRDNVNQYAEIPFTCGGMTLVFAGNLPDELIGVAYKVRIRNIKYRKRGTNTWVNAVDSTEDPAYRQYSTRGPFVLPITKPSKFYLNGLNTFGATINSTYTSEFSWSITKSGIRTGGPVRALESNNYEAPYIKSGTTTDYIYWVCSNYGVTDKSDPNCKYTLTVRLTKTDPSNVTGTSFTIVVAENEVTGSCYYRNTDQKSMYTVSATISDPSGNETNCGSLLRNTDSRIQYNVNVTLKYGAYVHIGYQDYSIVNGNLSTAEGILYQGTTSPSTTLTKTLYVPPAGSTFDARVYATTYYGYYDDPGNVYKTHKQFSILDYAAPTFSSLSVDRCTSNGTLDENGEYCKIVWGVSIKSLIGWNTKSLTINHTSGTKTYDPLTDYIQSGNLIVAASTEQSYDIAFTLKDRFNTVKRTLKLSSVSVIMDWLHGGKGVAFGKVASKTNVLEVSPDWNLVAYSMQLNGRNMVDWADQITARITALEQFASNARNGQWQVTFYNGSKIVKRQWITTGNNATKPANQEKESTATQTFSFVGWNTDKNASTNDATVHENITANKSIYAIFGASTRYYSAFYYNGGNLLATVGNKAYHSDASYSGSTPTGEGTFVGFSPTGKYLKEDTSCYAKYFVNTRIDDSWEDIVASVEDGTYLNKYKIGQYKQLDLGTEGIVTMRLVAFKADERTTLSRKAAMTFISITPPATKYHYNPTADSSSGTRTISTSWESIKDDDTKWRSLNNAANTVGEATFTVELDANGRLEIWTRKRLTNTPGTLQIKVNDDEYANANSSSTSEKLFGEYTATSKKTRTFTITLKYTIPSNAAPISTDGYEVEFYASIVDTGADIKKITVTENKSTSESCTIYTTTTGTSGGWAYSELQDYLKSSAFKNKIPSVVRNAIKPVYKYTYRVNKYHEDVNNSKTSDSIWVPSYAELFGYTEHENLGPEYGLSTSASREIYGDYDGQGTELDNTAGYYLRSVSDATHLMYIDRNGTLHTDTDTNSSVERNICFGFCL